MTLRRLLLASTMSVLVAGCSVPQAPLSSAERADRIAKDWDAISKANVPIDHPVTMYEAMARAIQFNLDQRQKLMDSAIAEGVANVESWDLLPKVATSAGYSNRSNDNGNVSQSLTTGITGTDPSTNVERRQMTAGLTATWNVLDFGVSYLKVRQDSNKVLIAEEKRRKAVQNIVQDVQTAWLKAVIADRLVSELDPIIERVKTALESARTIEDRRLQSPMQALDAQKQLLDVLRQLQLIRREVINAKVELANLMNVPPVQELKLASQDGLGSIPAELPDLAKLEEQALHDRPELREEDYQVRITADETRKAILRLLPGIELNAGRMFDSNRFLYNNYWSEAGLKLTWNLINLFAGPSNIKLAENQEELGRLRRLALHMAVVTQVHVAWNRMALAREDYDVSDKIRDVDDRLFRHSSAAQQTSIQSELEFIRRDANRAFSRVRRDLAYVELEAAAAAIRVSVGDDPISSSDTVVDTMALASRIEAWHRRWEGTEEKPVEEDVPAEVEWQVSQGGAAPPPMVSVTSLPDIPTEVAPVVKVPSRDERHIRPVSRGESARLQLGSYKTPGLAWKGWKALLHKEPSLSAYEPSVREAMIPDVGTVHRLMITGDRVKLREVCGTLSQSGIQCLLLKGT